MSRQNKANKRGRRKRCVRDSHREKVRQKSNWKPRQKGPENWHVYLKMKGSCSTAHTDASANCSGEKVWSGLKYALNKLSGGQRRRWSQRQRGNAGVTEENNRGRGKRWTHKHNDEKMVQDSVRGKSGTQEKPYETMVYILYKKHIISVLLYVL